MNERIRVLVVDDSALMRKLIPQILLQDPRIEVVGTAMDGLIGLRKIEDLRPHVVTLDLEMPRMDGLTFLKKLMHFRPMPVIVISSLAQASCQTAMQALTLGAVEVLAKPGGPTRSENCARNWPTRSALRRSLASAAPLFPPPTTRPPICSSVDWRLRR